MMRQIFLSAMVLGPATIAAAQMSSTGLTDADKAAWQKAREDGLGAPSDLEDLAYCAVIWNDWKTDLETSGNESALPEYLDMRSARSHAWAYDDVYETTQKQEFPEWPGTARSFGPFITAVSEVIDVKADYRDEYFWGLSWCYRDDLFEKSRT